MHRWGEADLYRCDSCETESVFPIPAEDALNEFYQSNNDMRKLTALYCAMRKSVSGVSPSQHLWGFTVKGFTQLIERCGFSVLKVEATVAGHRNYDPLYYDLHPLAGQSMPGVPYYFWQRISSILFRRNGTNLTVLARRNP
jgi:hypothetical protein